MGQAMWIFVFLVLLRVSICRSDCGEHQPEKNFLRNIDKLLNLNLVKITNGLVLRKKGNMTMKTDNNDLTCDSGWIENLRSRVERMMETHVIEFDLSSVVNGGNVPMTNVLPKITQNNLHMSLT
jgi:hypothetical protein